MRAASAAMPQLVAGAVAGSTEATYAAVRAASGSTKYRVDRGIRREVKGSGAGTTGVVFLAGVARLMETGTRRHEINLEDSDNEALMWYRPAITFARSVQHPGARPKPFLARGLASAGPAIAAAGDAVALAVSGTIEARARADGGS